MQRFLLVVIVIIGAILRGAYLLQNRSFWWDESAHFAVSQLSWHHLVVGNYFDASTHPPFFRMLVKAMSLVSLSEWWLRLTATIPSFLSIPVLYAIGLKLFSNKRAASVAVFAYIFSAFHIYQSVFVKETEMVLFFNLASFYAFLRLQDEKNTSWKWLVIFDISLFLSIITSFYSIWFMLLLIVGSIYAEWFGIISQKRFVRLVLHIVGTVLFSLYWSVKFFLGIPTLVQQIAYIASPSLLTPFETYGHFLSLPTYIAFTIVICGIVRLLKSKQIMNRTKILLIFWVVGIMVIATLISFFYTSLFLDWYLSFISIGVYMLLGVLFVDLKYVWIGVVAMLMFFIGNTSAYISYLKSPTEDWRGASKYLFETINTNKNDLLYVDDPEHFNYYIQLMNIKNPPILVGLPENIWSDIKNKLDGVHRVCYFSIFSEDIRFPESLEKNVFLSEFSSNPYGVCFL